MSNEPSTIERALQLAAEGRCRTVADIKRRLRDERYTGIDFHLDGASIRKQLNALMVRRSN